MRWGVWGNMNEQYSALPSNVSMLGKVLGDTIKDALGENILDRVETIRKLSKSSRAGNEANRQELLTTLQNLSNDELLPVARAFSQFLNLANTYPEKAQRPTQSQRRDHQTSGGIAVSGAGVNRPPDRDHPPDADP